MFKVKLEANFPAEKAFKEFQQEFEQLLKTGLDDTISQSISALQSELKQIINVDIRNVEETPAESVENNNINIPKADADIIEYLTDVNITEINKTKKHQTSINSNTMMVQRDKWGGPLARISLDVGPGETIEAQYAKAKDFFNKALFVIPQQDGTVDYRMNTGVDLSRFVKIVCSTDTGVTDNSEARLERFKEVGGKAEWTLKQEAFKKVIEHRNSGFLDLSTVVTNLKDGKYAAARQLLERFGAKNSGKKAELDKLTNKIIDLEKNNDPKSNVVLHQNLVKLIDNIKVAKQIAKTKTLYKLETDTVVTEGENRSFFDQLKSKLNQWVINYEVKWFNSLIIKVKNLIKKYTG